MNSLFFIIIVSVHFIYLIISCKRYIHMLQLNSYKNDRYTTWFWKNWRDELKCYSLIPILSLPFLAYSLSFLFFIFWVATHALLLYIEQKNKYVKKPLVITNRIKRLYFALLILWLLIMVFFSVFLSMDLYNSVLVLLMLIFLGVFKFIYVVFANTLIAPIEMIIQRWYVLDAKKILRSRENLIIIGLTGSYGKTSTKYILNNILSAKYNVIMTPESYNTLMGVVRAVRELLKPIHNVFIVEMGAKQKGDIDEICQLVRPRYGILTSIGYQHLETFKTFENIIETKYELINSLPVNGIGFLNFDNDVIRNKTISTNYFSFGTSSAYDYWAEDIRYDKDGSSFVFCGHKIEKVFLQTRLLGLHNVRNIVCACSVATELGIDMQELKHVVRQIAPVPHRLQLINSSMGMTIIDDSYNSNPEGSLEALNVLKYFNGSMKILVSPGMVELGACEYDANRVFGQHAASVCDYIILVGHERSKAVLDGVQSYNYPSSQVFVAANLKEATLKLHSIAKTDSVVLFENDLPDNYEK